MVMLKGVHWTRELEGSWWARDHSFGEYEVSLSVVGGHGGVRAERVPSCWPVLWNVLGEVAWCGTSRPGLCRGRELMEGWRLNAAWQLW